jgi:hypothetical protein
MALSTAWKRKKTSRGSPYWYNAEQGIALCIDSKDVLFSDSLSFPRNGGTVSPASYLKVRQGALAGLWIDDAGKTLADFFSKAGLPLAPPAATISMALYPGNPMKLVLDFPTAAQAQGFGSILTLAVGLLNPQGKTTSTRSLTGAFLVNPPVVEGRSIILNSAPVRDEALISLLGAVLDTYRSVFHP